MPITRKPKSVDEFLAGAPDARRGVRKGKREQITLTIVPALLADLDEFATRAGQSRAAVINRAIHELVRGR